MRKRADKLSINGSTVTFRIPESTFKIIRSDKLVAIDVSSEDKYLALKIHSEPMPENPVIVFVSGRNKRRFVLRYIDIWCSAIKVIPGEEIK